VVKQTWNDEDAWGDDDWNLDDADNKAKEFSNFDYNKQDLNKLSNKELEQHKKKMDEKYYANFVSPNDPTFEYDKRVTFDPVQDQDNSWDENEDEGDDFFW